MATPRESTTKPSKLRVEIQRGPGELREEADHELDLVDDDGDEDSSDDYEDEDDADDEPDERPSKRRSSEGGIMGRVEGALSQSWVPWVGGGILLWLMAKGAGNAQGDSSGEGEGDMGYDWFDVSDARIAQGMAALNANAKGGRSLLPVIERVARETRVYPGLIHALTQTESNFNPTIVGDNGNAHGLTQINDVYWHPNGTPWSQQANWQDPYTNLSYGIGTVLLDSRRQAKANGFTGNLLDDVTVAGFNAGGSGAARGAHEGDVEKYTYQGSYLTGSNGVYTHMKSVGV